ncbi:MAG: hypothetical protein EXR75_07500 [Myxococcales bacterium]|nr:hypothetical protein [Myxococcales bacterium]
MAESLRLAAWRSSTLRLALLSWLAFAAGCAPNHGEAWVRSIDAGKLAFSAGHYTEAVAHYRQAAAGAQRIKDRDEALFLVARTLERSEQWDDARQSYAALAALVPPGPRAARAAFDEARLAIEHGDRASGWERLARALETHPSHGAAKLALAEYLAHVTEVGGETALRERIHQWLPRFAASESEQRLEYELGLSFGRSGELAHAHAALLSTARRHPYPKGGLTDDALFVASEIAEKHGDPRLAIADLEELLRVREVATGGSYERPRFPAARMRIAELTRDRLHDPRAARDAFRAVYRLHPTSILADDALWQEARLSIALADAAGACEVATRLGADFSSSRYAGCVAEICPVRTPPDGRVCPDYIKRQLKGE